MRAIVGRFLLFSHPSGCVFLESVPGGLRFAPTPGYHLSSPSGKKPSNLLATEKPKTENLSDYDEIQQINRALPHTNRHPAWSFSSQLFASGENDQSVFC